MSQSPLHGIRILDFGRYIAAPYCASLLGALGAEVIRIEPPEGNDDRYVMPVSPEAGAMFLQVNRNKRSLPIDLRHPRATEVTHRLVRNSDVVIANMVPRTLAKVGLDYEALRKLKDDIILTNITAYGAGGPERDSIGFDGTGQAMSGAIHLSGWEDQPFRAAVSYVDYGTALASAFATLAAIHEHGKTGRGQEVQTSLLSTALTMMNPILIEEASGERSRSPIGNRSPIAGPSDIFATTDGWIIVQVIGQQMFERWTQIVGAPHLLGDQRFSDDIGRGEHGAVLSAFMKDWCKARSSADCLSTLRSARIPCSPVLSPGEALAEQQNRENGFLAWEPAAGLSQPLPFVTPFRLAGALPSGTTAPALGQGARAVLRGAGFSAREIDALRDAGVISLAATEEPTARERSLAG
ncbi:CaiB/BaiF CoA transferase family protein [Bosea sp. MMO-172]|uniref:CaiB/BaiF CoA transferase family protein n=1 Tax=Bosea sp. MMO-172 TaxID=3127885 RepID=UPI0030195CAB